MKKLYVLLLCLVFTVSIGIQTAYAEGDGNMDGGGGGMGNGNSDNYWNGGDDGVRITVIKAGNNTAAAEPVDFSNKSYSAIHFGKISKLEYRSGKALNPSGSRYTSIAPAQAMPRIVSGSGGSNIQAIKTYFCSEYAAMMVADATGISYQTLVNGEYKLLIEPIAYFHFNGTMYAMTATEAALYDQLANGDLRSKMVSLTHKNLPLSIFLEYPDVGFPAWDGPTSEKVSNSEIINKLGLGIVKYKDEPPIQGEINAPDVEYRVDTDVITSVTLRTDRDLTPDNPASVRFNIDGRTYTVNNIVIPAGDSQVVWVKWHTPSAPATLTIRVSVSGAYTAEDTLKAKIVDLNDKIPPDPLATDTHPGYIVPSLPTNTQKTTANWGVWDCYWEPVWVWCSHGTDEDGNEIGHWVDEGYWEFEYTGYSASLSGTMGLMPDDVVPTANGKTIKSGYGVKTEVSTTLSTSAPSSHFTYTQTAFSTFPEFQYQTYHRLLERITGGRNTKFQFQANEYSITNRNVHFLPVWYPDGKRFTVYTQVWDTWTPDGMLSVNLNDYVSVQGSLFDDWYTSRE